MSDDTASCAPCRPGDCAPPLRALAPDALVPEQYSERALLASWLHRVDYVRVKCSDGKRYEVDVYLKIPESRLPSTSARSRNCRAPLNPPGAPDFSTERGYAEFSKLLDECYYLAVKDHGFLPCAFCPPIADFVVQDKHLPSRMFKAFHSDTAVCELLTAFVSNLLELVRQVPSREHENDCPGKQQAPMLMKRFLCGENSDARG